MKAVAALFAFALGAFMLEPAQSIAQARDCQLDLKPTDGYKELSAKLKCLKDELSELRKAVFPKGPSAPAASSAAATVFQESGGVRIEIEKCSKSGGTVDCRIHITSIDKDQSVGMAGADFAVDDAGVTYGWRGFQKIGEKNMETGGNSRIYIAGVRTAAVITFAAQTENPATIIKALQLTISPQGSNSRSLTFRNINLR